MKISTKYFMLLILIATVLMTFIWVSVRKETNLRKQESIIAVKHGFPKKEVMTPNNTHVHRSEKVADTTIKQMYPGLFAFTAIARLDPVTKYYTDTTLIGWKRMGNSSVQLTCCYKYNNSFTESLSYKLHITAIYTYKKHGVFAFMCPIEDNSELPTAVSVKANSQLLPCPDDAMKIVYPKMEKGKLAICTKMLYGYIEVSKLIEWFEMQRILGVDKIFLMVMETLHPDNLEILQYYERKGFADLISYATIESTYKYPRPFSIQEWQTGCEYCFHAMRGYTYASILDVDEIYISSDRLNIKEIMEMVLKEAPRVASVVFKQLLFPLNFMDKIESDLFVEQYQYRLEPTDTRPKTVYINERTDDAFSHATTPKAGFEIYDIPPERAAFHHYRKCTFYIDCQGTVLYHDDSILYYASELRESIAVVFAEMEEFRQL